MGPTQRCLFCLKLELFIFNLIFWLGGCGALGVGLWLALSQGRFSTLSLSLRPWGSRAGDGRGGCGDGPGLPRLPGAATEQRCLLLTVLCGSLTIILLELSGGPGLLRLPGTGRPEVGAAAIWAPGEPGLTQAWDTVQTEFRCCGVQNYTDWFEVRNGTGVPQSCCLEHSAPCSGIGTAWWQEPCYEKVKSWVGENVWAMGIFAACIAVVRVLGLVSSMLMYCQVLKVEKYYH
ncbi:unnamed protein product [Eretmochelys imbricata]